MLVIARDVRFGGRCRRRVRIAFAFALSVVALLALGGVAQAVAPKLVLYGHFAASGVSNPNGIAVDQENGDLYASGFAYYFAGGSIGKFDGSGSVVAPSPFGEGSEMDTGTAVNPVNGHVYVLENAFSFETFTFEQKVVVYDPADGERLSSFAVPGPSGFGIASLMTVQIASDAAGHVYVPIVPLNEVQEYSESGTLLGTFSGSGAEALNEPSGVAVDSSGDVWVADRGNERIEEFSSTGAFVREIKDAPGVRALALDGSGDVLASMYNSAQSCGELRPPCDHVVEYSPTGALLADVGAGDIGHSEFEENGKVSNDVAVNDTSGQVYVTDMARGLVWVFVPPSAPVIQSEVALQVTNSTVSLGARVNPGGIDASYRFEYGTSTAYGQSAPFPEGDAGTGFTPRTVWASAFGLQPGTTYHYRVVVNNELGTVYGMDQTFTTQSARAACPNESSRVGFSAGLPDCRAYELVTPPNKASAQPAALFGNEPELNIDHATSDGNGLSYYALDVLPVSGPSSAGEQYLATRGPEGWSSENVVPPLNYYGPFCPPNGASAEAFSSDLSHAIVMYGGNQVAGEGRGEGGEALGGGCEGQTELVSGEPKDVENLFVRDNVGRSYQLVDVVPDGVTPGNAYFEGASADLSRVIFADRARLVGDAPANTRNLYEWSGGGVVRLATRLPDGSPVAGSLAAGWVGRPRVISADGTRFFFTANGGLYARIDGSSTVQLDASQAGGGGGGGRFQDASVDGSQVFFTDDASAGLTSDTVAGSGANLYRYDLTTGELSDLTPGGAAGVLGVAGVSGDGSYVYFAADSALPGASGPGGSNPVAGQANLYVWHAGTVTFIHTDEGTEFAITCVWEAGRRCGRVSTSGRFFAFESLDSLTGYDNSDASTGFHDPEVYLYDASEGSLVCASCNPSGEAPAGGAEIKLRDGEAPRNLSDSGRLVFETRDALLPSDTNGQLDVYEFEDGQLSLISTGTSAQETNFVDASPSGDDIFLREYQKLVPQDKQEEAISLYDARVDGGFPTLASPPACTTAESCRSAPVPQPSIFGAAPSATFSGVGNLAPAKAKAKPRRKKPRKRNVCRRIRNKHKRARCLARRRKHRKAKSHKGGK